MKITLINPDSPGLIDPKVFPPLGILYLSAVLKKNGYKVEVIDLAGKGSDVPPLDTDIIGITSTTPQFHIAWEILHEVWTSHPYVIIGGPHATVDPLSCLKAGFDGVIIGEGEKAILQAIQQLQLLSSPRQQTFQQPLIENLDTIPFPDRQAIDLKSYHYTLDDRNCTNIISSRGCPYNCSFCCKIWGSTIRYRSSQNVIEEARLLQQLGYDALMFYDDEMLLNKKRDLKIFQYLHNYGIIFRFFSRVNLVNKQLLQQVKSLGCAQICFGIESGSDLILKNVNKGFTINQAKQVIKWCHEVGLSVKTFLIVGLPGETPETLQETEDFLEETRPDDMDFTTLSIYPETDIFKYPKKYDLSWTYDRSWYKTIPGEYKTTVSTSSLTSEEILEARDYLEERFKKW